MFYDPATQTVYSSTNDSKILGLPRLRTLRPPALAENERAVKSALPTLQGDGTYAYTWTIETLTSPEVEAKVQDELDALLQQSGRIDRAIAYTLADIWQQLNPGLTKAQARGQVRDRLQANLREIKGL